MTDFLRLLEANLFLVIPALLAAMYLLSRLSDQTATRLMAVVAVGLFAAFMLFMAVRVPSLDLILFVVVAFGMAAYDFVWSSRRTKDK